MSFFSSLLKLLTIVLLIVQLVRGSQPDDGKLIESNSNHGTLEKDCSRRNKRVVGGGQSESFSMEATGLGDLEEPDAVRKMLRRSGQHEKMRDSRRNLLSMLQRNLSRPRLWTSYGDPVLSLRSLRRKQELLEAFRRMNQNGDWKDQPRPIATRSIRAMGQDQEQENYEVLQFPLPYETLAGENPQSSRVSLMTMRKIPEKTMESSRSVGPLIPYLLDHDNRESLNNFVARSIISGQDGNNRRIGDRIPTIQEIVQQTAD